VDARSYLRRLSRRLEEIERPSPTPLFLRPLPFLFLRATMIRITMTNGDQHDVHHGSTNNERKWCHAYLRNQDMIATTLFFTDDDGLEITETYGAN
jgi:hypothetical protein